MDALYDEFSSRKEALQHVAKCEKTVGEKWQDFFKCAKDVANFFQLLSFVFSLPGSNAFPARIFSLLNSKWRCDRNRMSVPLVKAELQVFITVA